MGDVPVRPALSPRSSADQRLGVPRAAVTLRPPGTVPAVCKAGHPSWLTFLLWWRTYFRSVSLEEVNSCETLACLENVFIASFGWTSRLERTFHPNLGISTPLVLPTASLKAFVPLEAPRLDASQPSARDPAPSLWLGSWDEDSRNLDSPFHEVWKSLVCCSSQNFLPTSFALFKKSHCRDWTSK